MTEATSKPISRRTVAKGAAWTAPVVTLGVAAPMAAASPPPVNPTLDPNGFCKHPGNPKRYHVGIIWNNTLNCSTTVTITGITLTPNASGEPPVTFPGSSTFTVGAKSTATKIYDSNLTEASSNGTVNVQYTYTNCDGETVAATVPLSAPSLPPCQQIGIPDYPHDGSATSTTSSTSTSEARKADTSETTAPADSASTQTTAPTSTTAPAPATTEAPATGAATPAETSAP